MKCIQTEPYVHIVLSRKNVESLLHMLDNRDKEQPGLAHHDLIVEVEEDNVHYVDREAGQMSWERA